MWWSLGSGCGLMKMRRRQVRREGEGWEENCVIKMAWNIELKQATWLFYTYAQSVAMEDREPNKMVDGHCRNHDVLGDKEPNKISHICFASPCKLLLLLSCYQEDREPNKMAAREHIAPCHRFAVSARQGTKQNDVQGNCLASCIWNCSTRRRKNNQNGVKGKDRPLDNYF